MWFLSILINFEALLLNEYIFGRVVLSWCPQHYIVLILTLKILIYWTLVLMQFSLIS